MTTGFLMQILVFAGAMTIPIVAVQLATFILLRKYAARFVASLQQVSQLVASHDVQIVEVARLVDSAAAHLAAASARLSPPESA